MEFLHKSLGIQEEEEEEVLATQQRSKVKKADPPTIQVVPKGKKIASYPIKSKKQSAKPPFRDGSKKRKLFLAVAPVVKKTKICLVK